MGGLGVGASGGCRGDGDAGAGEQGMGVKGGSGGSRGGGAAGAGDGGLSGGHAGRGVSGGAPGEGDLDGCCMERLWAHTPGVWAQTPGLCTDTYTTQAKANETAARHPILARCHSGTVDFETKMALMDWRRPVFKAAERSASELEDLEGWGAGLSGSSGGSRSNWLVVLCRRTTKSPWAISVDSDTDGSSRSAFNAAYRRDFLPLLLFLLILVPSSSSSAPSGDCAHWSSSTGYSMRSSTRESESTVKTPLLAPCASPSSTLCV